MQTILSIIKWCVKHMEWTTYPCECWFLLVFLHHARWFCLLVYIQTHKFNKLLVYDHYFPWTSSSYMLNIWSFLSLYVCIYKFACVCGLNAGIKYYQPYYNKLVTETASPVVNWFLLTSPKPHTPSLLSLLFFPTFVSLFVLFFVRDGCCCCCLISAMVCSAYLLSNSCFSNDRKGSFYCSLSKFLGFRIVQ